MSENFWSSGLENKTKIDVMEIFPLVGVFAFGGNYSRPLTHEPQGLGGQLRLQVEYAKSQDKPVKMPYSVMLYGAYQVVASVAFILSMYG